LYLEIGFIWKTPDKSCNVRSLLQIKYPHLLKEIDEAIDQLIRGHFLIPTDLFDKNERFSRQLLYYALSGAVSTKVHSKLKQKHVAILGCGGIGNLVSASLATMGIGELTLVDGDFIELSNLARQLMFTEKDEGKQKVDVLKLALMERCSNLKINILNEPVTLAALEKLEKSIDLYVLSADTVGLQDQVNLFCVQKKVPFINIGYVQDIAVFGPFVIPGLTGCYNCRKTVADNENISKDMLEMINKINYGYQSPSIGPINMMAASYGTLDILKYLGNFGIIHSLNKRIGIWTNNFTIEQQECSKNPNCKICGYSG